MAGLPSWAWDVAKIALGLVVGDAWKGFRDRKRNREVAAKAAKQREGLQAVVAEYLTHYRVLDERMKSTPEGSGKRMAQAGLLNRAETLRDAYRLLGNEVEALEWANVAKDWATVVEHQPLIDEEARRHAEAMHRAGVAQLKAKVGREVIEFHRWQKLLGHNPEAAEKARASALNLAKFNRQLGDEGEAAQWDTTVEDMAAKVGEAKAKIEAPIRARLQAAMSQFEFWKKLASEAAVSRTTGGDRINAAEAAEAHAKCVANAYRELGEEAEALRWEATAKEQLATAVTEREKRTKLEGLIQEQTTLQRHFMDQWRRCGGAMGPNKRMWADKARIAAETIADAHRKLGNETEALRWENAAKNTKP
jgi:hypothetical protein